jgi:hypothetical protein
MKTLTLRPTEEQVMSWAGAARMTSGKPVRHFVMWAADWTAAYIREQEIQNYQQKQDPILERLEEKKRLRRLMDAAWHALDFLPPPDRCPAYGSIRDPKKDLREALEAVQEHLAEVQDEWR